MPTRRTKPHGPRPGEVVISDDRAMKALAHPARLTAVDELYGGRESTASELARLAGVTPSAMSYHLRALERWGIVVRAPARGDGRERPWRAAGSVLAIRSDPAGPRGSAGSHARPTPSQRATMSAIALQSVDQLRAGLADWLSTRDEDPWHDIGRLDHGFHFLTHDEAVRLAGEIDEVFQRYRGDGATRPSAGSGEGRRRTAVFYAQYLVTPPKPK